MAEVSHFSAPRLDDVEGAAEELITGAESYFQAVLAPSEMFAYLDRSPAVLVVDSQEVNRRVLRGMLKREPYRILEAGQAPAHVGRMVISGRMVDVCAELDRLAAREAAFH